MKPSLLSIASAGLFSGALVWACSSPDSSARVDPIGPNSSQFKAVAPMLVRRCGSIECHGSHYRNLRMYGYGSERLEPGARPDFPARITDIESTATYDSLIALEPEPMRVVVAEHGASPERLELVRKAHGEEQHRGDRRITPGDDADKCLLTWLAGAVDTDACDRTGCVGDGGVIGNCNP